MEFFEVHKPTLAVPTSRPRSHWCPPPMDCYKANMDAALFDGLDRLGWYTRIMKVVSLLL